MESEKQQAKKSKKYNGILLLFGFSRMISRHKHKEIHKLEREEKLKSKEIRMK